MIWQLNIIRWYWSDDMLESCDDNNVTGTDFGMFV